MALCTRRGAGCRAKVAGALSVLLLRAVKPRSGSKAPEIMAEVAYMRTQVVLPPPRSIGQGL